MKIRFTVVFVFILAVVMIAGGCGGSGGRADSGGSGASVGGVYDQTGSYSISVNWPGAENKSEFSKIIPTESSSISISITGELIDPASPVVATINSGVTTMTISNIPIGKNEALIKALDSSGATLAQRKESFTIILDKTTTAESVPLGIAIVEGGDGKPVFEPSNITFAYGPDLYVQNWTSSDINCSYRTFVYNMGFYNYSLNIPGSQVADGQTVYNSNHFKPWETFWLSMSQNTAAAATVKAPVTNYQYVSSYPFNYDSDFFLWSLARARNGDFYISSYKRTGPQSSADCKVIRYSSTGQTLNYWNTPICPYGIMEVPDGSGDVYVSISASPIKRYGRDGTAKANFLNSGVLSYPQFMSLAPDGSSIWIADGGDYKIKKFSSSGQLFDSCTFGFQPEGIAVDPFGNVFTSIGIQTGMTTGYIGKYTNTGSKSEWSGYPGAYCILTDSSSNVYQGQNKYDSSMNLKATTPFYNEFALDEYGNIYCGMYGSFYKYSPAP